MKTKIKMLLGMFVGMFGYCMLTFAYLLKLEMIERWVMLDKATGEKTFREIVGAMKKGSEHALEEFGKLKMKN